MAWNVIPAARQQPGELIGGVWVVLQAWPIANLYTLALLGPEGARVTEGYGDWTVIPVRRNVGITEWAGRRNYAMSLDLLYDGWIQHPLRPSLPASFIGRPWLPPGRPDYSNGVGLWLEAILKNLEQLATPGRDMVTPPSLRIYGAVPHTDLRWVIQNLEWGDSIRDIVTGRRMRQQVTVSLVEYYQPTELQKLPRGKAK
jgi:hypothetical protein